MFHLITATMVERAKVSFERTYSAPALPRTLIQAKSSRKTLLCNEERLIVFLLMQRVVCFPLMCSIGCLNPFSSHSAITLTQNAFYFSPTSPSPSKRNPPLATLPGPSSALALSPFIEGGFLLSLIYSLTPSLSIPIHFPSFVLCMFYSQRGYYWLDIIIAEAGNFYHKQIMHFNNSLVLY